MKAWMRVAAAGLTAGTLAVLAGCESDGDDEDAGEAGGTTVVTNVVVSGGQSNVVVVGGQTNVVILTNSLPSITPVIPTLDPAAIPKPDLRITDLAPVVGVLGMWQVKVTVRNAGTFNAGAFDINLYSTGSLASVLTVPGLLAGKQAALTFPLGFGCPDNAPDDTWRAVADPANQIKEANEANNAYQEVWSCPPL